MTCAICIEDFTTEDKTVKLYHCNHIYHDLCLNQWIYKNNTCPLCRVEIVKNIINKPSKRLLEIPYRHYDRIPLESSYIYNNVDYDLDYDSESYSDEEMEFYP